MADTARLETFSDGIFAIAATLLILDVNLGGEGSIAHQLVQAWPSYAAYAISFATLGIVWVNHHTVFTQIDKVDRTFLFINVLFLMVVAFTPFPTRVLADNLREQSKAAAFFYGLTYTAMAICYSALWFYAAHGRRLLVATADQRLVAGISRSFPPGMLIYAIATLSALVSAIFAVVLYALIALFYVVESSIFGRTAGPAP